MITLQIDLEFVVLTICPLGRVEIDAKIHAGYFTTGKVMTMEELSQVQGRAWEDVDVSTLMTRIHFYILMGIC